MAERAQVFEGLQLGVETTPGTAVACNRKLYGVEIHPRPMVPTQVINPVGQKFPSDVSTLKEHTEATLQGILDYIGIPYLLSSLLNYAASASPTNQDVLLVTITGSPVGGTFLLTYRGQTTAPIAFGASSSAVQSALRALTSIGSSGVTVAGVSGGPWTLTFDPSLAPIQTLTKNASGLTGGTSPDITIAPTSAASLTHRWVFNPSNTGPDTIKSYTLQKGSSVNAYQFPYGIFTGLDIKFDQNVPGLSGTILGQKLTDGASMTSTPTDVGIQPVSPTEVSVYLSTDDLTYTLLTRLFETNLSIKNRFAGLFTIDSSQPSFSTHIETKPELMAQIVVEQDTTADTYMASLRARTLNYLKIVCTGPAIEGNWNHRIVIQSPIKFENPNRQNTQEVESGVYDLRSMYNSAFGGAMKITVDSTLGSL